MELNEDTDTPPLSPASLVGIQEFHSEQKLFDELALKLGTNEARSKLLENDLNKFFPEDWVSETLNIAFASLNS